MQNNKTPIVEALIQSSISALISALIVIVCGLIITKIPYYLEIIVILILSLIYSIKYKRITTQVETIIFAASYTSSILVFQILFMGLKASSDIFFFVTLILSHALLIPKLAQIMLIRLLSSYCLFFAINRIYFAYLNPEVLKSENLSAWFQLHKKKIIIIFTLMIFGSIYIAIPKPNSFTKTGSMHYPYGDHAILLKNGDALIFPVNKKQTETYNEATGEFTLSGVMNQIRHDFTATLLDNGKVLIIGGINPSLSVKASNIKLGMPISITDTELYNPNTQQFQYSGKMITPRQQHIAVLLPDGNVLVAGGLSYTIANNKWSYKLLSSAEIYDVKTGKFKPTGNMYCPRQFFSAVLLKNGKVLITGGKGEKEKTLNSAEIYDPSTGLFTLTGNLEIGRMNHKSIALKNGNAAVLGGQNSYDGIKKPEIYNIKTGQFKTELGLDIGNNAVMLPDGKIFYASGGIEGNFLAPRKITNVSEICDLEKLVCSNAGKLKEYRYAHTAVSLNDNKVLVIGGYKNSTTPLTSAELFTYNKKVD